MVGPLPFGLPPLIYGVDVERCNRRIGIVARSNDLVDVSACGIGSREDLRLVQDGDRVSASLVHPQCGTDTKDTCNTQSERRGQWRRADEMPSGRTCTNDDDLLVLIRAGHTDLCDLDSV